MAHLLFAGRTGRRSRLLRSRMKNSEDIHSGMLTTSCRPERRQIGFESLADSADRVDSKDFDSDVTKDKGVPGQREQHKLPGSRVFRVPNVSCRLLICRSNLVAVYATLGMPVDSSIEPTGKWKYHTKVSS
jgi:hypothetical protein